MSSATPPEKLTVLYDGACPLCRREIAHAKRLAQRSDTGLCFIDISNTPDEACTPDREKLLARFHVQRADGSLLDGAAAFVAMWARLPGWRWLAKLARVPGMLAIMEAAYRGFLRVRPWIQARVRRFEVARAEHAQHDLPAGAPLRWPRRAWARLVGACAAVIAALARRF